MAQIRWLPDLIVRVQNKSDGSGDLGARAAAELAGDELPRRRCTGEDRTLSSRGGFEWELGREAPTRRRGTRERALSGRSG